MTEPEVSTADLSIKQRHLELEERRLAFEIATKSREHDEAKSAKRLREQITSPFGIAILTALVGLGSTVYTGIQNLSQEKKKQETAILSKILEVPGEEQRAKLMLFYNQGEWLYLTDEYKTYLQSIAKVTANQPISPPLQPLSVPPASIATAPSTVHGGSGIDTPESTLGVSADLRSAGVAVVGRYLNGNSTNFPHMMLTHEEALSLSRSGCSIISIFHNTDQISHFTLRQGAADAKSAMAVAKRVGQPVGTAIYFEVDFDASDDELSGHVRAYFEGVRTTLTINGTQQYLVGVYGSGNTCHFLSSTGLVQRRWLAQSRGWGGYYAERPGVNIWQGPANNIEGLNCDTDFVSSSAGAFVVKR
jgi:hypothetical protein